MAEALIVWGEAPDAFYARPGFTAIGWGSTGSRQGEEVRFATDSLLEEAGFEPSVPLKRTHLVEMFDLSSTSLPRGEPRGDPHRCRRYEFGLDEFERIVIST
jgi:hypothetical protein